MKILITGGKGVVGSALVKELEARGHAVWVCDLKHSYESNYFRCDVAKYRQLLEIFKNHTFDYVYHLAAEYGRWNGEDYYEDLWITNAIGTKNMLRLQEEFGFRMIFTSSSEVYGDHAGIMAEDVMDAFEIKQMNDYAISKWANELQIINSQNMSGTQVVRVRLFNTYGPGEYFTPYRSAISIFIYKAIHDLPFKVYLNHKRTSIYIDDCALALANIPDNFQGGQVYNIAGNEVHSMKEISDMILGYLGTNDSKVHYVDTEPFTTLVKIPAIATAKADLKYRPRVILKQGIPRTIEWMKTVYNR